MDKPQKIQKIYEVFESRRGFPRLAIDMPVTLIDEDGKSAVSRCHDLSPDGIQVRYTADVAHGLFGSSEIMRQGRRVVLTLNFVLVDGDQRDNITIKATPVYQHRVDDNDFLMGMHFSGADHMAKNTIEAYLYKQLEVTPEELFDNFHPQTGEGNTVQPGKTRVVSMPATDMLKQELLHVNQKLQLILESIDEIKQRITELEQRHD